jgi:ribonuclease HI
MQYVIYCDGSTRDNGSDNAIGAYSYVILQGGRIVHSFVEAEKPATNQRMELKAAIAAAEWLARHELVLPFDKVIVYTDSAYLHNCYTQKWYKNWEVNGWRNSKKEPVANKDLWEQLIKWFEMPEFEFKKVKGHATDDSEFTKWNNYVDELAQNASAERRELEKKFLGE